MTLKYDATSGVYLAIQKLLANNSNQEFLLNYTINNNSVNIQTFSELQKTSLNDADNRQLYEAFINAGVEHEQAERLADRVIDWRDPDSSALLLGMEDNGYRDQGKFYGAKDKRFEDLVELLLIDEIQPEVFQDLADFFTLYGKSSGKLFSISSTANSSDGTKHYQIRAIVHLTFQSNQPYRILKWHYNQG